MCNSELATNLGFTCDKVPVGTHMCLIFSSDQERRDCLLKYLLSGLQENERGACFSNNISENEIRQFLLENNISYDERKESDQISVSGTNEVYFANGAFDPDRMLETLKGFYLKTKKMTFSAARVIGEMAPEVQNVPGGDRLLEYESRVTLLVREFPVTSICLYDARTFNGATILEVLKVHPKMIVNGAVITNPFFIKPEDYLKSSSGGTNE